jgi:hypothetical protein
MSLQDLIAGIPIVKDIASVVIPIFGVYVAWTGLNTWKRQLTANADRDLARRLLIAVYKVRNAMNGVPLLDLGDLDLGGDPEIKEANKTIHDHQMTRLEEAQASLDVELLEAEAVWGDELIYRSNFSLFKALQLELQYAYSDYYYGRNMGLEAEKEAARILFYDRASGKDEFRDNIKIVVNGIEDFLRPKLQLKEATFHMMAVPNLKYSDTDK